MKRALADRWERRLRGAGRLWPCLLAAGLAAGCAGRGIEPSRIADIRYKPSNIYRPSPVLDPSIKRVAVLPITTVSDTETFKDGAELLQQYLGPELEKTKRFELVIVSSEQLRQWTGQETWRADEALPRNFFDELHEACGCDAVFFAQLIRYHPYQPVAVGWKLSLCQASQLKPIWAADEVFDAGDAEVANAARRYSGQHVHIEGPLDDPAAILGSPSRFGQYSLSALLATLPER
ncbi:MAG: hypothetical protein ABSF38_03220 [Verrucomicrobiota bacterium]|jgi:hypothetical protein